MSRSTLYKNLNVSRFPLRDPDILISIMERGSDIWPKGHLRLLSLNLKFKEQGRDVSQSDRGKNLSIDLQGALSPLFIW